jgi:hypothetical protein
MERRDVKLAIHRRIPGSIRILYTQGICMYVCMYVCMYEYKDPIYTGYMHVCMYVTYYLV